MKKKIRKLAEILKNTSSVGIAATMAFTAMVYNYYSEKTDLNIEEQDHSRSFRALEFIDNKTLDLRLRQRGPIEPKEKIAILAVDDASLNQIGRWPWSRDKIAELVDRLMSQGAKVLAFDMVFSEPQIEKANQIIANLEKEDRLPPEAKPVIQEIKSQLQPDQILANTLKKYNEQLIMGTFYDNMDKPLRHPYQDLCYTEAFKRSQGYLVRKIETWPLFIFNEYYNKNSKQQTFVFENSPFEEYFKPIFEKIEIEETEKFVRQHLEKTTSDQLTPMEQSQIMAQKENSLREYCGTWLLEKEDRYFSYWEENWSKLVANEPQLANTKLREELDKIKGYMFINPIIQTGRWTIDIPDLANAAAHFGSFAAYLDPDGTIRRSPLFYRTGARQEDLTPSLALQAYLVSSGYQAYISLNQDRSDIFGRFNTRQFAVAKLDIKDPETDQTKFAIPIDHRGRLIINYAGPQMAYPHLPASELFHDRPKIKIMKTRYDQTVKKTILEEALVDRAEFIKDRIFVLGATAIGVYDLRVTPLEENYPGVETHVNVLANLMSQNFLKTHPKEFLIMVLSLLCLGIGVSFLLNYVGALSGLFTTAMIIVGLVAFDWFFLFKKGIVAGIVFPIMEVSFIYIAMTFVKYFTEERKKKYLRATFSKYVSPAIVDEILKDPENIQLGGRKQKMSVFFSDVRGFTTISEKLDPQVLASVLNEYLTPMTYIVFNNKGTLDKYMGDAIMAFFGAPIFFEDHAKYACRCALQSIDKLKELQEAFRKRGLPVIDIGIGINTYEMSVGNMGSDIVRSYTVMGDGVNLGSRLEGINKEYGTRIIISEFTFNEIKNDFTCREVDWVRVKGKLQPIKIYELISEGPTNELQRSNINLYNEGYSLYRELRFQEALDRFQKALSINPEDPVSKLYVERCLEYLAEAPPANWDGVFVMKTK